MEIVLCRAVYFYDTTVSRSLDYLFVGLMVEIRGMVDAVVVVVLLLLYAAKEGRKLHRPVCSGRMDNLDEHNNTAISWLGQLTSKWLV